MALAAGAARADNPSPGAHSHRAKAAAASITFARDIAPLFYSQCAKCHHQGEVAPFPLTSYKDAKDHARTIAFAVDSKTMPPWKADSHGEFRGERKLTPQQIAMVDKWVAEGAPLGDAHAVPPAPHFPAGWTMGQPDAVFTPKSSYTLAADGADVYRCFVIPTNFDTDRYVQVAEVKPGNRRVVHHVIAYLDSSGEARRKAAGTPDNGFTSFGGPGFNPSGSLGGWVPGLDPLQAPPGAGMFLPKGADLVLQVHYHKDGKPETDLTRIGLYFAHGPVDKRVHDMMLINPFIHIPAGDANYEAHAALTVPEDVTLTSVIPHMHLLGHTMTVTAKLPDGETRQLIDVDNYDFNWQTSYVYKSPIELPKGTQLSLVAHYDNSTANPRNPSSPPKQVTWGEQTTDEMCIAFLSYTVDAEHLKSNQGVDDTKEQGKALTASLAGELVQMFAKPGETSLDVDELAQMIRYMQPNETADPKAQAKQALFFDKNHDGRLDADELASMLNFMGGPRGNRRRHAE